MVSELHHPPQWMLDAPKVAENCKECGDTMRRAEGNTFCLGCWEWRTNEMVNRAKRAMHWAAMKMREAVEKDMTQIEDFNVYRLYEDKACADGDWQLALHFKWRIAVLELTGKTLPMTTGFDRL